VKKILVVGQTPPPYGGQAIMIQNMLKASMPGVQLFHTRMNFSSDMEEVGKFKIVKIIKLLRLIVSIYFFRLRHGIENLYYPPAPSSKVPMIRDIIVLLSCRWLFRNTIFHFHAAGISEMHKDLTGLSKIIYEKAYFYPEYSITLSEYNPKDGNYFRSKCDFLIPNGLADISRAGQIIIQKKSDPVLLFMGVITESKGVLILLKAAHILTKKAYKFKLMMVGRFESQEFENKVYQYISTNNLTEYIWFTGVLTGNDKINAFANADIFCFPTFFEAETFGLVALEAMQFSLPVVATFWRGVPSIVRDDINGFTVPPQNAEAFADRLERLMNDPELCRRMGKKGREIYLTSYTAEIHFQKLHDLFRTL
jgi:glycosyltransferase involved in cell wall biosynthesis